MNYGRQHREEKRKKLSQLDRPECQMTGIDTDLDAHHSLPRMFNGPDIAANYQILHNIFHQYLHDICNVRENALVGKRLYASNYVKKHILDDEKRQIGMDKIEELDNVMMAEYVAHLVFELEQDYRGILYLTLLNQMKTNRDLAIENHRLQTLLSELIPCDQNRSTNTSKNSRRK